MDIVMPQLGETVAEGTITNWYKQVGDAVQADEALFDVETDKVSTEIPSPISGVLAEVLVPAGQTVKVGTRLAVVRPAGAQAPAAGSGRDGSHAARAAAPVSAAAQMRPPASSASASGVAAAPRTHDARQKLSPVVRRLLAEHGLEAAAIRGSGRDGRVTRDDVLHHVAAAAPVPSQASRVPAAAGSDSIQRALFATAAEPEIRGRSPLASQETAPSATQLRRVPSLRDEEGSMPAALPAGEASTLREGERVIALNGIRRRSAAAMARAWQVVPHVLQAVEANYARIEQARNARQAAWQAREGFELTYLPFLAFAVCQALQRYEQLNARIEGDALVVSRRVHLGIAVDLNHEGLVVPVIRDAQDRNVPALAREIRRLALGARSNKLKPDDFGQPTYTISNSGVFGTLITAPIVNPPQVAILSTDGVSKRPVVIESPEGDSIAVRPVGVLAQSFDHRAVDGAYSAAFLKELKRIVETRAWIDDVVV